jgi:hypothetical protein
MFKIRHNIINRFCCQHTLNNKTLIKKVECIKDKLNNINKKLDTLKDMQDWSFIIVTTSWVNIIVLMLIQK